MKKTMMIILLTLGIVILFSSCQFIENNLAYLDSPGEVFNATYTMSVVGLVLFLWGKEF